jgi:hypothetical protein
LLSFLQEARVSLGSANNPCGETVLGILSIIAAVEAAEAYDDIFEGDY